MIPVPKTLIVGLAVAGVAFACGMAMGGRLTETKWQRIRAQDAIEAAQVITVKEVQVQKCQAEVSKVNEATTEQATKTTKLIVADQAQRKIAEKAAERRLAEYERRQAAAFETLDELRRSIDAGLLEGCANERVGADIVRVLNSALAEGGDRP